MSKNDETKQAGQSAPVLVPVPPASTPQTQSRDPNWGRGGSYVRDPKTGIRELVDRTIN